MRRRTSPALGLLGSLVLTACHGSSTAGGSLPCDVDAVLASQCRSCHGETPLYGAPMPLVTYADLTAPAPSDPSRKVYELVGERTHDDARPMPQPPAARLDAAAQQAIDAWIAAGAPSSAETCAAPDGGAGGGPSALCTPDVPVIPSAAYTVPADVNDAYICYGIDVTAAEKRHITAFLPHVDNPKVVHHMVLFQSDTAAAPGPTSCALGGSAGWRMVGVWAPGNDGFALPEAAGIPLEGTAHYVVQVHYNNVAHLSGEQDRSGFDLCTTANLRPNDADVLAFGSISFTIPAQGSLDLTCDYTAPAAFGEGIHIIGAMPHMHKLGARMSTARLTAGDPEDLGTRDPWDFETQYWSPVDRVVAPGDTVRTRCVWDNPSSTSVGFGENTEDEMCFDFAIYYPRITGANWKWLKPAVGAACAPTP